jgi:hypothetical protein
MYTGFFKKIGIIHLHGTHIVADNLIPIFQENTQLQEVQFYRYFSQKFMEM